MRRARSCAATAARAGAATEGRTRPAIGGRVACGHGSIRRTGPAAVVPRGLRARMRAGDPASRVAGAGQACAVRTERGSGMVRCLPQDGALAVPDWRSLIYARAVLRVLGELRELDPKDRLGPALDAGRPRRRALCRGLGRGTRQRRRRGPARPRPRARGRALAAMRKRGLLDRAAPQRLHLCLASGTALTVASARIDGSAPWPGGIPRLKLLREAPSRSALKIEEAWLVAARRRRARARGCGRA